MSYAIQSRRITAVESGPARFAVEVRSALRGVVGELAGVWRHAVARREFNRLDASTLRDLGMSRSEFDSYWAETHGDAEQTRVRVIHNIRGRYGL
jgi:uncharacterized protein YjiS (DUF1127 family)